jgi:hypothetical protein
LRQLAQRNEKRKGKAALATVHMVTPRPQLANFCGSSLFLNG